MAPILDAHQHFWVYNAREYPWMGAGMDRLRRDHLPPHLAPLLERTGVGGTVAVQARRTVAETEWLLDLAGRHPFVRGVVGWVDMASPHLGRDLARLAENPLLVGIRELIHDMPEADYAVSPEHVRAIALLADLDLSYDLLLKPPQLAAAVALVGRFPEVRFVVDHIAKPDMRTRREPRDPAGQREWLRGIRALAERPNVSCKLSGLVTECDWERWRPEHVTPFLDVVLEAFGPDRVMIGSDWPVCTCAADYGRTMGLVRDYAAALSDDERDAVLGGNCARFYRLERVPAPAPIPEGGDA